MFEGENNIVQIGANTRLNSVEFILRNGGNNIIRIGEGTTTGGNVQIEASEGCLVELGQDCMLSHNINIYTTDSHSICDMEGKRINQAKNIRIGDHVWIGMNAMILKGSIIPDGCIIGANSLYCKNYNQKDSIYAGAPARMVKDQIQWSRKLL